MLNLRRDRNEGGRVQRPGPPRDASRRLRLADLRSEGADGLEVLPGEAVISRDFLANVREAVAALEREGLPEAANILVHPTYAKRLGIVGAAV